MTKRWIPLVALLLSATAASSAAAAETPTLWAGHQIVWGTRKIPLIGSLDTRTDTYVIARMEKVGDELKLVQNACRFDIAKVAGVKVSFRPGAETHFPQATIRFRKSGDGWLAEPWSTRWKDEDIDQDGKPGATLDVDAPLCGGTLYVGATSHSRARGVDAEGGLRGELQVEVEQKILDTSGACLSIMATDTSERVRGNFAYVPVPEGTTCESLQAGPWPAHAAERDDKAEKPRAKLR